MARPPRRTDATAGAHQTPHSVPTKITIPAIGVNANMLQLGLNADGTVQTPPFDKGNEIGWYRYSPTPGEIGPSILIGHVDTPAGPAVFYRLGALQRGDTIRVRRANASTAVFTVTRVALFSKNHFPTHEVYGNIDHAGLRLITCGGAFIRSAGGYQGDTVVFATLDHMDRPGTS